MITFLPLIDNLVSKEVAIRGWESLIIFPVVGYQGCLRYNKSDQYKYINPKNNLFIFGVVDAWFLIIFD